MRIFIGINFDETLKSRLATVQKGLKERTAKGTFTRPDNFHLTLRFLGEREEEVVACIQREVAAAVAQVPAFKLELSGTGLFSKRSGAIPWLGVAANPELERVYQAVTQALERCGIPPEDRPYTPHLTFGRNVRFQSGSGESFLHFPIPPLRQEVRRITLFQSHQVDGVLTYTPIADYPLFLDVE